VIRLARPLDELGGSTACVRLCRQSIKLCAHLRLGMVSRVQRQLPGDWMVEANYLGNTGKSC
jgi:hypothetical protein